ncbi:MAG: hypothetical protein ACYTGA_11705, partial [Planctomycetota bacterium]
MSKQAFIKLLRRRKTDGKKLYVYKPVFIFVRGRGKRQRISKLNGHTPEKGAQLVDAADLSVANEVAHVVGVFLPKLGNAEA